jgi:hypothetical protein
VLGLLPAADFPAAAAADAHWRGLWQAYGAAWRGADEALGQWRNGEVASGAVVVDIDALMYGRGGGLQRPADGVAHGMLLLAMQHPDYLADLKNRVLAEAAAHVEHSPWLTELCRQAAQADAAGIGALVAVALLLPQARRASDEGRQKVAARQEQRLDELGRLAQRVNEVLAGLRGDAAALGLLFGADSRERLAERLRGFQALAIEARGLIAGGEAAADQVLRTVARAEPLVGRMRDRLEDWQSASRINQVWRNENVRNTLVGTFFVLLMFAPQWLPLAVALPLLFGGWRLWIVARQRSAIRQLAAGLPPRITGTAPP